MAEHVYRPGAKVPESGVYLVTHGAHREPHEVTLVEGEFFPECARCLVAVRFTLLHAANPIEKDADFRKRRRGAHGASS